MQTNKYLALTALGFFMSGCTGVMTKETAAIVGAATCGAMGAGGGAAIGSQHNGHGSGIGIGAGVGAVTGALICGGLAYLLTENPKPPPPPPPPPAKPKPPPPPPPPPAPKVERTIILDDVLFDFDKSAIKPEGAAILDRLVAFMNENRDKKVSLSGYTDSIGTDAYNMKLSDRRWMSAKDYIVKKGVDAGRVSGEGFGKTKPIADNKTAEGRAKNRRVELKVN